MAGWNQAQFVVYQTSSRGSTPTITTNLQGGPKDGMNDNSSGSCGYVRTLCKAGRLTDALDILKQPGIEADSKTYGCLLQECTNRKDLAKGRQVHAHILQSGFQPTIFLLNTLINMYAKCGRMVDACQVFNNMPERDLFTWTTMIAGYAKHGCGKEACTIYDEMHKEGVTPNRVTFICILNAFSSLGALEKGKRVHSDIIKAGILPYINLENTLVDMYAKCGSMTDARQLFNNMVQRDVVSWNVIMAGYAQHGGGKQALEVYEQMQWEGVIPNRVTFVCVLNACASLGALEKGREVHTDIIKAGIVFSINLENTLVDMYAKCGSMKDACHVFESMVKQDVVSWSVMIQGYAQHGCGMEAFKIYEQMKLEGVTPNRVTFICILNACASLGALEKGKEVHADIIKAGILSCIKLENTLVDMYAKCASMNDARQVFDNMAKRNVVSWSAMITGYVKHGCGREAFKCYEQMQREGVTPNIVTFICALNACASLGALEKGKEVHADVIKAGIPSYIDLENTLVDMYAKCGSVVDARQVFDSMSVRDVVSWSVMIAGYGQHGCGRDVLQIFQQMQCKGFKPDSITFISVLSACSHAGLVDEGCHYFDSMRKDYGLTPTLEHFGCMVDLLGRAGRLDEAEDFINTMPIEPDASVWGALLGACRIHGNVVLAECVAKCIVKRYPRAYVLLSNIYAAADRWPDKAKVERKRCHKGSRLQAH